MEAIVRLTHHAETRSNQRGIKAEAMDVLLKFGKYTHNYSGNHGTKIVTMTKAARERACKELGKTTYAQLEKHLDSFLVVAKSGWVVTCVHRTRRILRDPRPYRERRRNSRKNRLRQIGG